MLSIERCRVTDLYSDNCREVMRIFGLEKKKKKMIFGLSFYGLNVVYS